jgi:hypothetical protein
MVATGEKRFPEKQSGTRKRTPPWLWPLLVASDVIFLGLVAYFLVMGPQTRLMESLTRFIDAHFTAIALSTGAIIAVALFFALHKSKQPLEELTRLANEMGWTLKREWGFSGGFGAVSLFGYGPYFSVWHNGLKLAFSPIIDEDCRELGLRVTAYHNRRLGLGLMLKAGVGLSMAGRMPDEHKSILSKKLDMTLQDVQAWAGDRERAMDLLSEPEVLNRLDALKRELDLLNEQAETRLISRSSGFVVGDRRISMLLSKNHHLNRPLIDAICELSIALTMTRAAPTVPVSRAGDRVYRAVLVTLISLVAASLLWVLTDYLRGLL